MKLYLYCTTDFLAIASFIDTDSLFSANDADHDARMITFECADDQDDVDATEQGLRSELESEGFGGFHFESE